MTQQIAPIELKNLMASGSPIILDVREAAEFAITHLPGSLHIPMQQIPARVAEIDRARPVVVICHHGMRSAQVAQFLKRQGFADVHNLAGGLEAWAQQVDPAMPRY